MFSGEIYPFPSFYSVKISPFFPFNKNIYFIFAVQGKKSVPIICEIV